MVAMSASSIQPVLLFLIALITIRYQSAGESSQLITCSQPYNFTVQITENERVVVYGIELLIRYNRQVGIFSFPGIEPVNIVFNESIVEFKGYMSEYPVIQSRLSPERLSWISSGIILGIGTLQKLSSGDYAVRECRLFLPNTNVEGSANLPLAVEDDIIHYVHSCITERLCEELGTIKKEWLQNINRYDEFGPNIFIPRTHIMTNSDQQDPITNDIENLNINVLVDIALKNIIKYIKSNDKSTIKIPDISEMHTTGFGITCYFQAVNGTFEDLSTLKRTEDAFMSNIGQTQIVRAGFGLSTIKFNYDYYKLKFGFLPVSGKILGIVDGLALTTRITIDYDQICDVKLDVKVTELGEFKVKMTGLSILNSLISQLLVWLTKTWRNNIIQTIEINLKNIIEEQLSKYICVN